MFIQIELVISKAVFKSKSCRWLGLFSLWFVEWLARGMPQIFCRPDLPHSATPTALYFHNKLTVTTYFQQIFTKLFKKCHER